MSKSRIDKHKTGWRVPFWIETAYIVDLVVFVLVSMMLGYFVYANTMDNMPLRYIRYVALAVMILKILAVDLRHYSKKRLLIVALGAVFFGISAWVSGSRGLLWTFVAVVAAFGVDFRRALKNVFIWESALLAVLVVLSLVGVIPDRLYSRGGQLIRHSLGFKYATYAPLFFLAVTSMFLYLKRGRLKLVEVLVVFVASGLLLWATDTRFEPVCAILLTLWFYFEQKISWKRHRRLVEYLAIFATLFAAVLSIVSVGFYNPSNEAWRKANALTSGRLELLEDGMETYGVTPFGNEIEWVGLSNIYEGTGNAQKYNAIDNIYMSVLLLYGVFSFILVIILQQILSKVAVVSGDVYLQMILVMFALFGILNPHTLEIPVNMFLLILGGASFASAPATEREELPENAKR